MANNLTKSISVNGWANLRTILGAAGWTGIMAKSITVVNNSATLAYLHFTNSGSTAPATAADGLPLATAAAPSSTFTEEDVDVGLVWINTPSALNIIIKVVGK